MEGYTIDGAVIPADKEGYLQNLGDWTPTVAEAIATHEGLSLTADHWEIIELLREFHAEFGLSPAMRPLVRYVGKKLGTQKGQSLYLLKLFPGSPAKLASKIAGLPRPNNCI